MIEACDYSMPCFKRRQAKGSMYWWNDELAALRREGLAARPKSTRSKGDAMLNEAWKGEKAALRQGIKKSRLQCWKDLIGEVDKDPWDLALKIVTKRLVTRRKTPGLDNPDRVKYIVRSLFPHVEPFQRLLRCPARRTLHSRRSKESLQLLSSGGKVPCRLEEAELGPAEEG